MLRTSETTLKLLVDNTAICSENMEQIEVTPERRRRYAGTKGESVGKRQNTCVNEVEGNVKTQRVEVAKGDEFK